MISNRRSLFPQAGLVQEGAGDASAARVSSEAQPSGLSPAGDCAKLVVSPQGEDLAAPTLLSASRWPQRPRGPATVLGSKVRPRFSIAIGEGKPAMPPDHDYSRNRLGARPEKTQEDALKRVESPLVMQNIAINYETKSIPEEAPRARGPGSYIGARRLHVDVNQTQ
jgi:hypothetical protein